MNPWSLSLKPPFTQVSMCLPSSRAKKPPCDTLLSTIMTCQTVKLAKNLTVKTTGTAYRFLQLIQRHCPVQTTPRSTSPRMSTSNLRFATVLGDGHHIFDERVAHEHIKFAFRYNFGRSTPHFWREICASLQFCAIDGTLSAKALISGWAPSHPAE